MPATVFDTEWFSVDAVFLNSKDPQPYYRVRCQGGVQIVALTPAKELVLVRQFRPAIETHVLELPSGYVDKGETHRRAARRELQEETGYVCDSLIFMGFFHPAPSRVFSKVGVFFGKNARLAALKKSERGITVTLVKESRFNQLVLTGKLPCVSTLGFYHLAKIKGLL